MQKITIVPHTQGALGYTMQTPEEERFLMDRDEIYAELRTLLGGRAAEKVAFNTMTTGASNDIERATDLARKMITMYGMSDKFGVMGLATIQNQYLDGQMGLTCAQDTAAQVDAEIHTVLSRCFDEAVQILSENRELLDEIAGYLLIKETITGSEMMAIIQKSEHPESSGETENTSEPAPDTAHPVEASSASAEPSAPDAAQNPAPEPAAPSSAPSSQSDDASSESAQ